MMGIMESDESSLSVQSTVLESEAADRVLGEHVDVTRIVDENGVESVMLEEEPVVVERQEGDERSSRNSQQQSSQSHNNSGDEERSSKQPGANVVGAGAKVDSRTVSRSRDGKTMRIDQNDDNILRRNNFNHQRATGMSVRCHCNLATCVHNNYMCKSERRLTEDGKELEAGCFVEEIEGESNGGSQHGAGVAEWNGRVATARRGCIEMLSREKQEMCSDRTGAPIHCCTQDMCNYPKSFYPSSFQTPSHNRLPYDSTAGIRGMTPQNLDHQVWLRAAVIAVPICGLMILVVLIIVARRLLQSDDDYKDPDSARNRRKSMCASAIRHPNFNYNSHGPGQHMHVKPVFIEPNEYLLPKETHCCCHNTSSENSLLGPFAFRKNSNAVSETEGLVNNTNNVPHHCHCLISDTESHTGSFCSGGRASSLTVSATATSGGGEDTAVPKKFDLLAKLGLNRAGGGTDSNHSNHTNRPFHV